MTDNSLVTEQATDATAETGNQAQKTYTQSEVDNMMARMKGSLEKKLLKPWQDLGDPEELRTIKSEYEKRQEEQQLKRGEFEKTLQEKAAKWEAEIQKRDGIIREYKINTPLINAAAQLKAVNAEQVRALLMPNLRLNAEGEVEVVDNSGTVRYTDSGKPLEVLDLVKEFLDSNPHFKAAGPATTLTKSNVSNNSVADIDITKLDMKKAEHRKIYKAYMDNHKH